MRRLLLFSIGNCLVVIGSACALLSGCAARRPVRSYHFSNCRITSTSRDRDGTERKECECRNGKVIGVDARTRGLIVRCE